MATDIVHPYENPNGITEFEQHNSPGIIEHEQHSSPLKSFTFQLNKSLYMLGKYDAFHQYHSLNKRTLFKKKKTFFPEIIKTYIKS